MSIRLGETLIAGLGNSYTRAEIDAMFIPVACPVTLVSGNKIYAYRVGSILTISFDDTDVPNLSGAPVLCTIDVPGFTVPNITFRGLISNGMSTTAKIWAGVSGSTITLYAWAYGVTETTIGMSGCMTIPLIPSP